MPIAKETLRIGNTIAALPGNYVSPSAVETYGWQDLVDAGQDPVLDANEAAEAEDATRSKKPSKAAGK